LLIEVVKHLESFAVTRDESGATKKRSVLSHPMRFGKGPGIGDCLLFGAALRREGSQCSETFQ
jgi:hypothetical protein